MSDFHSRTACTESKPDMALRILQVRNGSYGFALKALNVDATPDSVMTGDEARALPAENTTDMRFSLMYDEKGTCHLVCGRVDIFEPVGE